MLFRRDLLYKEASFILDNVNNTHLPQSVTISVVVPVYKEEKNICPFLERIEACLQKMRLNYEIIFALDPSPDKTEEVILKKIQNNPNIKLLVFSRRFGQPAATMAGIFYSSGQTCVVIDVDLQDPTRRF
jgi:polyisoprenyl-phosphate glycosyltransferase